MLIQVLLVLAVLTILFVFVRSSNAVYVQASKRIGAGAVRAGEHLRGDAPGRPERAGQAGRRRPGHRPACCTRWWWRSWPACSASTSGSGWWTGATPSWPARWRCARPRWSTASAGCARRRAVVAVGRASTRRAARRPRGDRAAMTTAGSTSCCRTTGGSTWCSRRCAACSPRTTRHWRLTVVDDSGELPDDGLGDWCAGLGRAARCATCATAQPGHQPQLPALRDAGRARAGGDRSARTTCCCPATSAPSGGPTTSTPEAAIVQPGCRGGRRARRAGAHASST